MGDNVDTSEQLWTPEIIGERLRTERRRLGMSQEAFAKAGGLRRTTLYQYEHGDRRPSLDYLLNWARVGLDLHFVMTGKRMIRPVSDIRLSEQELARIFSLVNTYARDSRGRALAVEHQQELLCQLCRVASHEAEQQVDWEEIENLAMRFAG